MANEDAEPPRLVRPYIVDTGATAGEAAGDSDAGTTAGDGTAGDAAGGGTAGDAAGDGDAGGPAGRAGPPAAASSTGAHRVPTRPSTARRPGATRPVPTAGGTRPDGAETVPGGARAGGPGRRRLALIGLAVVAVIAGLVAVIVLNRRDPPGRGADPAALPLPSALPVPPDLGDPSTAPSRSAAAGASGGSGAASPSRSPSYTVPPRRSAVVTVTASVAGTPAAANPEGSNLALGRPATASSVEGDAYAPRFAVDGDPGTRWSSAFSDPQWISVDLGRVWLVTQVVLRWEAAYGVQYDLAVSTDGGTWRTVWQTGEGTGGVRDVQIAATPARFVRMTGTRRNGQYGYSLWELEIR